MGVLNRLFGARQAEPVAPASYQYEGYVDELSAVHIGGWVVDPAQRDAVLSFDAVLPATGEVLARGVADQFKLGASDAGLGRHGFYARLARALSPAEQGALAVRAGGSSACLPRAAALRTAYQPVLLVAMDIVDNCNLRCPFCLYDYAGTNTTQFMTEETLAAAIRFAPYTQDGGFWFSCLHEPTLHPGFVKFVEQVPAALRKKVFFTTNLAKRMPASYFEWLADSGIAHLNISIESLDPAIYERMRKGARHRIFKENWDALMTAFQYGRNKPMLRYIAMVYKSNLHEIPALVKHLVEERGADEVQLRFTFDMPHIPKAFAESEYIDDADWDWLEAALDGFPAPLVQIVRPPRKLVVLEGDGDGAEPALVSVPVAVQQAGYLEGRYEFRLSWDGTLKVNRYWAIPYDGLGESRITELNVKDIADPLAFLAAFR